MMDEVHELWLVSDSTTIFKVTFELILALVTQLQIMCACVCAMQCFGSNEFLGSLVLRTNVSTTVYLEHRPLFMCTFYAWELVFAPLVI